MALRSTIEPMQASAVSGVVRLLPLFDAYVLDIGRMGEPVLPRRYWKQVFRQGGWTTAVVLVDGLIKGVWDYKTKETHTTFRVELFDSVTKPAQSGIEAEAARLGEFLNTHVVVEYGAIA